MERERRLEDVAGGWPAEKAGRYWRHLGGWPGLWLRVAFLALTLFAIELHLPVVLSPLGIGLALLSVILAASAALPLAIYATIWAAFVVLRAGADDLEFPERGEVVASIDRWLGNGVMPSARLQNWIHDSAIGGVIDAVATVIHLSYFAVPHIVAVGFWWLLFKGRTDRFFRFYVTGLAAVMALGIVIFTLFPTAPPWLVASRTGESTGVERIAGGEQSGESQSGEIYAVVDPNPVAAMPSLHQAITIVMAGAMWWYDRRLGLFAVVYTLAMGFSLVYLGEHYLVDILAGWVLGAAVVAAIDRKHPCRGRGQ